MPPVNGYLIFTGGPLDGLEKTGYMPSGPSEAVLNPAFWSNHITGDIHTKACAMPPSDRLHRLAEIYGAFEAVAAPFRKTAACVEGCAFCCTDAGRIDVTTLEAMAIRAAIDRMPRSRQKGLKKALAQDMKRRLAGKSSPCPLLLKTRACGIYAVRPFACRRIYSRHACSAQHPPEVSRQVMAAGTDAIRRLQRLDDCGYSGHLSMVLYMLDQPRFMATYQAGIFRPEEISLFGRTHGIVINRVVAGG